LIDLDNLNYYIFKMSNRLIQLFHKIKVINSEVVLTGSLALHQQGIKLPRPPKDLDIHIPYGIIFRPLEGFYLNKTGVLDYPYFDPTSHVKEVFVNTWYYDDGSDEPIKIDVLQLNYFVPVPQNVYVDDVLCTHYLDILQFKLKYSFNKNIKSSLKHMYDLRYIITNNFIPAEKSVDLESLKLNLNLTRPLVFFDLETTGTDVYSDRIVEMSYCKYTPDGNNVAKTIRINPQIPIPVQASEVHKIYDVDVVECPIFSEIVESLFTDFENCDFAGYNILKFDIPLLVEEFLRCGDKIPFDNNTKFIDVYKIFTKYEKKDLSTALNFYCGRNHHDAHQASADVLASIQIFNAQLVKYDFNNNSEEFSEYGEFDTITISGKFARDKDGTIIYNFGKNIGKSVISERDYLDWIIDKSSFAKSIKDLALKIKLGEII
jgi:DNA polymerase-3 subunit epsilon